jgi:glycosyltransferase involved in cell wall biosynthesis
MKCPTLNELPAPPPGKTGWPWTKENSRLTDTLSDFSALRPAQGATNSGQISPFPRVSIIMPSYNQGEFIEESIRSVLLQGYHDLEYIIIDGGSTDESIEIIRRYEPWLAYWVQEPDRGQSHAINKGFERATGSIINWLNSDDLLYPGALRAIVLGFAENPNTGMIYGTGAKINAQGDTVVKEIHYRPHDPHLLKTRYCMLQQSAFMRRSTLLDVGLLDESIEYFMDWELSLRLSRRQLIYAIPEPIGMFRIQPAAKTQVSGWDRMQEIAQIARKYNGWTDRNFIVFWPLSLWKRFEQRTGWRVFSLLYKVTSLFFDLIYGRHTYMMH